jgi:thiosulfate dehydrogenase
MKLALIVLAASLASLFPLRESLSQDSTIVAPINYELAGPLVPAHTTIVTAWDIPKNPLSDSTLDDSPLSKQIRWGFQIFMNTPVEAARFTKNKVSCNNCHLNAGQRERAMPLVGVAAIFPEYNKRAGRLFSLEERIVGCFLRSENAAGDEAAVGTNHIGRTGEGTVPNPNSKEIMALSAYLTWLSQGYPVGESPPWRKKNAIPRDKLVPLEALDPKKGEALFTEKCTNCHGKDGQGVQIGDKKAGPLWGPDSWNDGAGAARTYTLAGIIRYMMPYLEPGGLTDEEAQHIAAFINSQLRPVYPNKEQDYQVEPIPVDAVYYGR